MSDLRDKQPDRQEIDLTRNTTGNHVYRIDLWCPTYSGLKNEDVYTKNPRFLVRAMSFEAASEYAQVLRVAILSAHDIWVVEIEGVYKAENAQI